MGRLGTQIDPTMGHAKATIGSNYDAAGSYRPEAAQSHCRARARIQQRHLTF
jgi:hypothetical protein